MYNRQYILFITYVKYISYIFIIITLLEQIINFHRFNKVFIVARIFLTEESIK